MKFHALTACLLLLSGAAHASSFVFTNITEKSLAVFEGTKPIFVYNHGVIHRDGVPQDRARSTYIHPLYGLDGEVLTDDFPKDHYHHRGLFWAWPHVKIGNQHTDLWMLQGIEQRFVRWLRRETSPKDAVLAVENSWFQDGQKVVREELIMRVHPADKVSRALDLEFTWTPLSQPLTLQGAEGKSYGGLTLRFAPRRDTVITTPLGQGKEDLTTTQLPWADLTARFENRAEPSGAAIFVAPDHPDFPPEWLTRHYGVLCLGWPGINSRTFQPGESIRCRYRLFIHRGSPDVDMIAREFAAWQKSEHDNRSPEFDNKAKNLIVP